MNNRIQFAIWCTEWNEQLSDEERGYLMKKYITFQNALFSWLKARDSGISDVTKM